VSTEANAAVSPVFDPQTWVDALTVHTLKRDMFSAKTLMAILDAVEQLQKIRATPGRDIPITGFHQNLFERLQQSFNNPSLLKEAGLAYLGDFGLPSVALKFFDLSHQFAPKDRDIEQLQKAAAIALARQATDQPTHGVISEVPLANPQVSSLIRKTTRLDLIETRKHLGDAAGELERKQQAFRKSGDIKHKTKTQPVAVDYSEFYKLIQASIAQTDFIGSFAVLDEARQAGAPAEELMPYYAQLGLTAFDNGRMEEALQAFHIMRELGPKSLEGWFNSGLVYQKVGQLDDAIACYQEATRLAPENAKTWCNLSSVWFDRGDYIEAEHSARKALEIRPDYARAWDNLASTLGAVNRLPEAAEACQNAIRIQPTLHSAWFKLGVINFQQDNLKASMEAFSLTGDNPDFFAYVLYYLSMIESRRGDLDLALQKLAQARAADPTNDLESSALKEIGTVCIKLGRYATAADFYDQITQKRPDDYSAWLSLGTAHHRAENLDKARTAYLHAVELQPDNPVSWHNLGLLASDKGNHAESRDCFQREVELSPHDAKAWYDLAVSYQALGMDDEGNKAYQRAEKLVSKLARRSSDLSAALSIVRRLNLGERVLKTE
jgi:tetratricopeptide (TPR) repeat protein